MWKRGKKYEVYNNGAGWRIAFDFQNSKRLLATVDEATTLKHLLEDALKDIREKEHMEQEGSWPADDLRRAFVAGAKWWELHQLGATMWQMDRDLAEEEAERRYPGGKLKEIAP